MTSAVAAAPHYGIFSPSDMGESDAHLQITHTFHKASTQPHPPQRQEQKPTPFEKSFLASCRGQGSGLMTKFLYFDGGHPDDVSGGDAWQRHILDCLSGKEVYAIAGEDLEALNHANASGIFDNLPAKLKILEYGTGGSSGTPKPIALLNLLLASGHDVTSYSSVDILERFAYESAAAINTRFNIMSRAVVGDFMASHQIHFGNNEEDRNIPSVIAVFGGTLANAPDIHNGIVKSPRESAAEYLAKMNRQHGTGSYLVLTYHAERDPQKLLEQYARTDVFEDFMLSYLDRAVKKKVITRPSYDRAKYWKMEPAWDAALDAIRINTVCTKAHTMPTTGGGFRYAKGSILATTTLCSKWDEGDYLSILNRAGYHVDFCRADGQSTGVLVAKAVRAPSI